MPTLRKTAAQAAFFAKKSGADLLSDFQDPGLL